jgi:hypothetical protein
VTALRLSLLVLLAVAAAFLAGLALGRSTVAAAQAPRPAPVSAPAPRGEGYEQGEAVPASPVAPERTAAPVVPGAAVDAPLPTIGTGSAAAGGALDPDPSSASTLRGTVSWYPADGPIAAAGPALRRALGPGWRGTAVRVSAGGRSVVVVLSDWCGCYRGSVRERLVDLSDDAFAELAPLAAGLVRVRLTVIVPPATDR